MKPISSEIIKLHNGVQIPSIGYRVDKNNPESIYQNVLTALQAGFRHIDLPADSESEKLVGKALQDSGVPRYELFLTLKLDNDDHGYDHTLRALSNSLKRVSTDYADLYLINWPNPQRFRSTYEQTAIDTWRAMETLYKEGKVRSIGLANYEARHIEFLLEHAEIAPMVNQARLYPGFPFEDNMHCANEHNIQTEGFLPPLHDDILNSREIGIFADKYHVTPRQICTRYLLEKGCIALCQGSDPQEMKDAFQSMNFTISKDDMLFLDHMKNYGPENINPDTCDF